jgi:hypothetical protein
MVLDEMRWQKEKLADGRITWVKKKSEKKSSISLSNLKKMNPAKVKLLPLEEKKIWFEFKCAEKRISFLEDSITLVI